MRISDWSSDVCSSDLLARQALPIGERGDEDGHAEGIGETEAGDELPAQVGRRELGGVDHQVGPLAQRRHQSELESNAVRHRPALGKRVATARLGIEANEHRAVAVNEQQRAGKTRIGGEDIELLENRAHREVAVAEKDADERTSKSLNYR